MKLMRVGPKGSEKPALLDAAGTLRDLSGELADITAASLSPAGLEKLRRIHPALRTHRGIRFYNAFNDRMLVYGKALPGRDNRIDDMILVAITLDPHQPQEADFELPLWEWQLPDNGSLEAEDLIAKFMQHRKICCFEITEVNPTLDRENLMAEIAFNILQRSVNVLMMN